MTEKSSYEHGQFSWVDLTATDMQAASKWYAELFGWEFQVAEPELGYDMCSLGGKAVCGMAQLNPELAESGVRPTWNSYVNVDDVDAVLAKVTEAGGEVRVDPMDAAGLGRLAFFTDTEGAPFGVWQAGTHAGSQVVNEDGAYTWNELMSRSTDAAKTFYTAVFGWGADDQDMPNGTTYTIFKNGDAMNAGAMLMEPEVAAPVHWLVYFQVPDIEASLAKIKETGGEVFFGPMEIPQGQIATVADPQGAVFALIQPKA